ncbi:hypothetical protein [Gordonia westfalica]|uniref:Uncharacterized protein n=1 Tax=Gordonia westfalica TaxID=158898 RepID=A0A1H2DRM3_9ACTN|nr:hypothetical protein [Gordonia westfalica]SDT85540.1 hypothetical protein SAMN04488548_12015 [Gordonia westfalica]
MTCQCGKPVKARGMCEMHYAQHHRRQRAYGRWTPDLVDAQPVREHILKLRDAGVGNKRLEEEFGVPHSTIQHLLYGQRGYGPSKQVRQATADRILQIPVPRTGVEFVRQDRVPALGTTRRLQALVANGYSQTDLISRLGWPENGSTSELFLGQSRNIAVRRARDVTSLFAQLQMVPGTDRKARHRAKAKGWLPPLAWDEDRIDDPTYEPEVVDKPRTAEDLFSDFEYLLSMGVGAEEASRRVGMLPASMKAAWAALSGSVDVGAWRHDGFSADVKAAAAVRATKRCELHSTKCTHP